MRTVQSSIEYGIALQSLCVGLLMIGGCAALESSDPLKLLPQTSHAKEFPEGNSYREQFQIDRNPKALNWLLHNEIQNGMTVPAVNDVLGESGERFYEDFDLKRNGGQYLQTDIGYKWGPDTKGRSVILFFRDGKLVNFDPDEFR